MRKIAIAILVSVVIAAPLAIAWRATEANQRSAGAQPEPIRVIGTARTGALEQWIPGSLRVTPAFSTGISIPTLPPGHVSIVTRVPPQDVPINEADLLLEVAAYPVFVLAGDIPMFRDLQKGDVGSDVKQLQQSLKSAGLFKGKITGKFGATTAAALKTLYANAGYDPADFSCGQQLQRGRVIFVPRLPVVFEKPPTLGALLDQGSELRVLSVEASYHIAIARGDADYFNPNAGAPVKSSAGLLGELGEADAAIKDEDASAQSFYSLRVSTTEGLQDGDTLQIRVAGDEHAGIIVPSIALVGAHQEPEVLVETGDGTKRIAVEVRVCVSGECMVSTSSSELKDGSRLVLWDG